MTRFLPTMAAALALLCAIEAHAVDLSDSDKAAFKAQNKSACMRDKDTVQALLDPGTFEAVCDCAGDLAVIKLQSVAPSEAAPLLDPNSEEGKKKWSEIGREAILGCAARPFTEAMQKMVTGQCVTGRLKTATGKKIASMQTCECISREFSTRYNFGTISTLKDQDEINRFALATMTNAQNTCNAQ